MTMQLSSPPLYRVQSDGASGSRAVSHTTGYMMVASRHSIHVHTKEKNTRSPLIKPPSVLYTPIPAATALQAAAAAHHRRHHLVHPLLAMPPPDVVLHVVLASRAVPAHGAFQVLVSPVPAALMAIAVLLGAEMAVALSARPAGVWFLVPLLVPAQVAEPWVRLRARRVVARERRRCCCDRCC